jgi:hypothetical protein
MITKNNMAAPTKKLLQEIVEKRINGETGELIEESHIQSFRVQKEPDFVKLYTDDILRLKDVPKGMNSILLYLLKRMNYENEVYVVSHVKKEMQKELELSEPTIKKSLELFVEKGLLIRKHRGIYVFDPLLVARGSWEDIRKLRLIITYEKGKEQRIMRAEFETE